MATPGWAAVWTLIAGVTAAVIGSAFAVILNRRRDRLLAQLDFVNNQLRYFYGPLLALTEASERAWKVFSRQHITERCSGLLGSQSEICANARSESSLA